MYIYPHLTHAEQVRLPKLIAKPEVIPQKFADSTHQLFDCQTVEGDMILKVCNAATIAHSVFWLGANHLFGADFPNSLGEMQATRQLLAENGMLTLPEIVAAGAHRFVLTRYLPGNDLAPEQITERTVIALAHHISKLHQYTGKNWGKLHAPQFSANVWSARLHKTLVLLAEQHGLMTDPLVSQVLAQTNQLHESEFVPMMLDLRWDQFRDTTRHDIALIDLDAFVIAPRALDLVLLEYVLSPAQWAVFKQHYTHHWPTLATQQPCYQLLLFFMHVLGETDLQKWMARL